MNLIDKLKYPINGLLFYFGWFAVLLFAADQSPKIALALAVGVILLHFVWCENRREEMQQLGVVITIGFIIETLLIKAGFLDYTARVVENPFPPLWILGIYGILSTTMNYSLTWVKKIPIISAICGGIGAALSYRAGLFMGAVEFPRDTKETLLVIGILWFFLFPIFCWISNRFHIRKPL